MSSRFCHLCGKPLSGRGWAYETENGSGTQTLVVCRTCHETAPRCDVCGMPVAALSVHLPDGRNICAHCHRTAVYDSQNAGALFAQVTAVVVEQLGLALNVGAAFSLVDQQHLQRLAEAADFAPADDPQRVIGLFVRQGRKRVMYVLSGLPRVLFLQTVAHEWAHAWQGENCPLLRDALVREGFAEWVAYKTLQALGAVKKATQMAQRSGLYGEGLQQMMRLEQQHGISGVLAFCRRSE